MEYADFGLMAGVIGHVGEARDYTVHFYITHTIVHSHVFAAVAW
jgi:hypothetical protein